MTECDHLDAPLDLLAECALIDLEYDEDGQLRILVHPLVREYALHGRHLPGGEDGAYCLGDAAGPSTACLAKAVMHCLASLPHATSVLSDLTFHLRRIRLSIGEYGETVLAHVGDLYYRQRRWNDAVQMLGDAAALADEWGEPDLQGRLLAEMGELLDRMEDPKGLTVLEAGLALMDSQNQHSAWAAAYLRTEGDLPGDQADVRALFETYRDHLGCPRGRNQAQVLTRLGEAIDHWEGRVSQELFALSSLRHPFSVNCLWDLAQWVRGAVDESEVARADALASDVRSRSQSSYDAEVDYRLKRLEALHRLERIDSALAEAELEELAAETRRVGLRGFAVSAVRWQLRWRQALREGQWPVAAEAASEWAAAALAAAKGRASRVVAIQARALATAAACDPTDPALSDRLDALEDKSCRHFANDALPWLLLARAFVLLVQDGQAHGAVSLAVQARAAFVRQAAVPEEGEYLYRYLTSRIDAGRPCYERERDQLDPARTLPPDFQPWALSRCRPLPPRVRCCRDGRFMRLIEGGWQIGPDDMNSDNVLYPFYVDEVPTDGGAASAAEARDWALGVGKRLPNKAEWLAVLGQQDLGYRPVLHPDRGMVLDTIDAAIGGTCLRRYPMPAWMPAQVPLPPVPDDPEERVQWIGHCLEGHWIEAVPGLVEKIESWSPASGLDVSGQRLRAMILPRLMSSLSLSPFEKSYVLGKLTMVSEWQLEQLLTVYQDEAKEFQKMRDEQDDVIRLVQQEIRGIIALAGLDAAGTAPERRLMPLTH